MEYLRRLFRRCFEWLEAPLDLGFGAKLNPMHHLGALTIYFFWIVLVSGIWLFIFFRTSVDGAYESVEYLTHRQWYIGGVMRSLHRYASDAAIVTLVLHIAREWVFDRYRDKRWFSWVTGIPLIWIIIPLGITGYWLVWDQLAAYVALSSAELLDALPIFTDSMARNFLSDEALSDRFFTLMAFLHLIGLPIFLVFAIWLHLFRISGPRINPPRALMTGSLIVMLVLSFVYPALSQGEVDLSYAPQSLALDWYYLPVYPLVQIWSPSAVWLLLLAISVVLMVAPWLPPAAKRDIATVDLDNCNGCRRCEDDCPYGAITMEPRSDSTRYEHEAVVDPTLCVSCGICVGACPTATPFRRATALSPGIDLPDFSAAMLRDRIEKGAGSLEGNQRIIVFTCEDGHKAKKLADRQTAVIQVRCMAQIPPSFIDYILNRDLGDGVFLAGCTGGDCQYRMGRDWTEQRIGRQRDPRLRRRIDTQLIRLGWIEEPGQSTRLRQSLAAFREQLHIEGDLNQTEPASDQRPPHWWRRMPARAIAFALFAASASIFSAWPFFRLLGPDEAMISLAFSHSGQRIEPFRTTNRTLSQVHPGRARRITSEYAAAFRLPKRTPLHHGNAWHRRRDPLQGEYCTERPVERW
jgi:ferredoxin/coenzyme F420-reducing hydrogenase delta subunit